MNGSIFESEIFIESSLAVIAAVVIFLISHFLCSVQGMGRNKIGKVVRSIQQASRYVDTFIQSSKNGGLERDKARKLLIGIRVRVRNSASVLQVYLYEGYNNPTVGQIISRLTAVEKECDSVAVEYNDGDREELTEHLEKMKKSLSMASLMLDSVRSDIEEERKKVI